MKPDLSATGILKKLPDLECRRYVSTRAGVATYRANSPIFMLKPDA
jgi:hypothetical protein